MVRVLHDEQQAITALCARFGVIRLDVFGSALRDDFRPGESDVPAGPGSRRWSRASSPTPTSACSYALRELLGGEVDLVMSDAVTNPYIAREIERTKQLLYAA